MKVYAAEAFGTFCFVFIGCSAVVTGGYGGLLPAGGGLTIGLAFGVALAAMAYAIGPASGAHLNPAVTLGVFLGDRMPAKDVLPYMIAQLAGAIVAALALWIIASGAAAGAPADLATTGWDGDSFSAASALIAELVATFVFVTVFLNVNAEKHRTRLAGLVVGLTYAALHWCFMPVSGSSLNPARSIGPALFSGSAAIGQLWLYLVAPLLGGALAGVVARTGVFEKD